MKRLAFAALIAFLAPACVFYTSDDDDCDEYGGGGDDDDGDGLAEPAPTLRNPETGECVSVGGGGGGGGGGTCGGREVPGEPHDEAADPAPPPNWGLCESACTALGEDDCLEAPGCRAIYVDECPADGSCSPTDGTYLSCWATPQPPVQGGGCLGLDAQRCSEHDDCVAVHYLPGSGGGAADPAPEAPDTGIEFGSFATCAPEPGADLFCYGGWGEVVCDEEPPPCVDGFVPTHDDFCWTGECVRADLCAEGTCGPETGECDAWLPDCEEGSTPGVGDDGCYTGYCIPADACVTPPGCGALDESGCIGRGDCAPYYEGEDCTCAGDVCDCAEWNFVTCEEA